MWTDKVLPNGSLWSSKCLWSFCLLLNTPFCLYQQCAPAPLPASYNHMTHHPSLIPILCRQCVVSPMMSRENLKICLDLSFMDSPLSGLVTQRRCMGCFLMSRYIVGRILVWYPTHLLGWVLALGTFTVIMGPECTTGMLFCSDFQNPFFQKWSELRRSYTIK